MFREASTSRPGTVTTRFGAQDEDPSRARRARKPESGRPSFAIGLLSKLGITKN